MPTVVRECPEDPRYVWIKCVEVFNEDGTRREDHYNDWSAQRAYRHALSLGQPARIIEKRILYDDAIPF